MDVTIIPNKLQGRVTPPPSKSQTHRVILAAALAQGQEQAGECGHFPGYPRYPELYRCPGGTIGSGRGSGP